MPDAPSRYDHDARVVRAGNEFTVTASDGTVYYVLPSDLMGWGIFTGPNLDLVPTAGGRFAIGIDTADHAIAAIIGDPT
jgi:hypothetical protein